MPGFYFFYFLRCGCLQTAACSPITRGKHTDIKTRTHGANNIRPSSEIKMFACNKKEEKKLLKCTRVGIADLCVLVLFVPSLFLCFQRCREEDTKRLHAFLKLETINDALFGYSDYDRSYNVTTGTDAQSSAVIKFNTEIDWKGCDSNWHAAQKILEHLWSFGNTNVYLIFVLFFAILPKDPGCPHPFHPFRVSAFCAQDKNGNAFCCCFSTILGHFLCRTHILTRNLLHCFFVSLIKPTTVISWEIAHQKSKLNRVKKRRKLTFGAQ